MVKPANSSKVEPRERLHEAEARRRSETRLGDMIAYAQSRTCRRRFLLAYFGESAAEGCGSCDVCLGRHDAMVVTSAHEQLIRCILSGIQSGNGADTWFAALARRPRQRDVDALVDWLLREEYVRPVDPLGETLALTEKGRDALRSDAAGSPSCANS